MGRVAVADVQVGPRIRAEKGDLDGMAASLEKYGQIEPIVIAGEDNALICGERRLLAAKRLGWDEIDAVPLWDLSAEQRFEIEREENEQRKELTEGERSKSFGASKAIADQAVAARGRLLPTVGKTAGRPPKTGIADEDVAQAIGLPRQTMQRAEQHVAAVESYPELEPLPQSTAISTAKTLDTLPEPARDQARTVLTEAAPEDRRKLARDVAKAEAEEGARILAMVGDPEGNIARAALRASYSKASLAIRKATLSVDPDTAAGVLDEGARQSARWLIHDTRAWLDRLEAALAPALRVVQGGNE